MSDNIGQLAWIANAAGEMQWYNKRWYEYFGTTPETTLGKTTRHLHHPDYWPKVIAKYKQSIAEGTIWEDTFPLRGADGNYRWFLSRAFPIRDDTGKITLWFGTNTDITELREMQTALQEANSQLAGKAVELEALVEQRTAKLQETVGELEAFSYSIAHDMRSPLRSLQGFSDLLLVEYGNKFDEEGKRYLQRIGNAATRLDKLILDVLNYSRVVRGDLPLEAVDLEPLLHDIVETYPMLAPEKAEVQFASPLPVVLGNQAMLTQIFSNLMGNAVKFVAPGVKPRIKLWAETHESRVRVFVQDNGIGISRDQQPKIFGIFQQVDSQYEGTGIGLAVVKKAVERIGGQVQVQSELGKGSTFWIELKKA
jgi:PAS domain S-box-containing protein